MRRRAVFLTPDAGPLISFAEADSLLLLLLPGLPIVVVDQVVFEATLDKRHGDAGRIADFIATGEGITEVKTKVGEAAALRRQAGGTRRQKGQVEAAIAELLVRLDPIGRHPPAQTDE